MEFSTISVLISKAYREDHEHSASCRVQGAQVELFKRLRISKSGRQLSQYIAEADVELSADEMFALNVDVEKRFVQELGGMDTKRSKLCEGMYACIFVFFKALIVICGVSTVFARWHKNAG